MKILKRGRVENHLHGTCSKCGCEVECEEFETKELIDRDTQQGMATRYVRCPECGDQFLWVR